MHILGGIAPIHVAVRRTFNLWRPSTGVGVEGWDKLSLCRFQIRIVSPGKEQYAFILGHSGGSACTLFEISESRRRSLVKSH